MVPDINVADDPEGLAVLLHPHPHFGGNRFHPFIDGLFRRLPDVAVSAVRFNFSSADVATAREEATAAIDEGAARWPLLPVVLIGYSFGSGIAASLDDQRVRGWYLLAPPAATLSDATIGTDPRPKVLVVPEHDQFSPPARVARLVAGWATTTVTTVPNADHFLGAVRPIVDGALEWAQHATGG